MFQHVVRWTFFITIWKKYKGQLLATVAYLLGLLVISLVHSDYLDYVSVSNQGKDFVSTSFLFKWIAYLSVTAVYFWIFNRFSKPSQDSHQDLSFLRKFGSRNKRKASQTKTTDSNTNNTKRSSEVNESNVVNKAADPFANIRKKDKLRSEADLIVEQAKKR